MSNPSSLSRRQFVGSTVLSAAAGAFASSEVAQSAAAPHSGLPETSATIFAFDNVTIPFQQNLKVRMYQPKKHPDNPVLARGQIGEPDDFRAQFYGSIIREGGKFRMWYMAIDHEAINSISKHAYRGCRAAYAESVDGIHWIKPKLGLVEHNGNRDNNLLLIDPPDVTGLHLVVLHEPDDPDPNRRYKMIHQIRWAEAPLFGWTTSVPLFSADGFRWKLETPGAPKNYAISTKDMPLPPEHTEQSGLYKWAGMYYLTGQQLSPWTHLPDGTRCGRVMTSFHSSDFVNWSSAKTLAYVRDGYVPMDQALGKESHSPASIWNRGNVLLGLHGLWEGSANVGDRRMPLGLLISNDGLHFRDAITDSVFVPAGGDGDWDRNGLLSGQGFEQMGDETYIWYGNWDLSASATGAKTYGGVGLLTMRRDGFGSLTPLDPANPSQFVTALLPASKTCQFVVNADGVSPQSMLIFELLDELERPFPQYSGEFAARLQTSGVQVPIQWPNGTVSMDKPFRLRVKFEGEQKSNTQLFAIYLNPKDTLS